jgi:hypothetical protein
MEECVANPGMRRNSPFGSDAAQGRDTIVMVRWALTIACGYLVVFSEEASGPVGLGPLVIVAFLASNLVIGRLPLEVVAATRFHLALGALDSMLIGASLYFAGQMSVELVVLFLGVLVFAIAGFRLGAIAALTMGVALVSLFMVWFAGSQPQRHSGMLLRVPFLLAAALVYAWLAESGRNGGVRKPGASDVLFEIEHDLTTQLDAIRRCQVALAQGLVSAGQAALDEVARGNEQMRAKAAGPEPHAAAAPYQSAVAHAA